MSQLKTRFLHFCITTAILLLSFHGYGQSDWKASVGAQLNFSELHVDNETSTSSLSPSAGIQLGLSYQVTDRWSLHTGVGLSYVETTSRISNYSDQNDAVDLEGENFEFRYQLNEYSETQKSTVLSIPVALQYESKGAQTRFYSKVGASANLFLSPTIQGEATSLNTSGYYERFNGLLTAPRFAGFGTFNAIEFSENDLEIENSFNAFLELGIKERLASGWLYIGVFMEYGLNDLLVNKEGASLLQYNQNNPQDFINNSVFNASTGANGAALIDKVTLNMIGLRINYEFGI